jgi:hypothetical protein
VTPPPTWLYFPATGAPPAAPWLPSDLADARCWLDASDSGTITLSGSSITKWEDKIGINDADDAVNSSNNKITTARPTIATAAQNSLDAVNFNGSQWFDHNTARGMLRNRSHALMVAVMKYGSVSNSATQFAWTNRNAASGTAAIRFQLVHRSGNAFGAFSQRLDADTTDAVVDTSTNPPYNTDWHIHVVSCNWGTGDFAYFVDGFQIGSTQTYAGTAGNTSDTDLGTAFNTWTAIGSGPRQGNFLLSNNSRIGALFCAAKGSPNFGSYTTDDRQRLEGYFAHRWGLTSLLDTTHPYKNAAP